MEFLAGSLLELITQTSTNLPPDVRAAMSIAASDETPGTQSSQALDIILTNVDMATEFTNMITAERTYQANSKVITTADSMLSTLVNMVQG